MPDLDQTIERIEESLDQIEAAQQLVKDTADQVSVLQKSAEGLVKRAETDFNAIVEKHKDLIGKMTQIAVKLEGFDFPDLKKDLREIHQLIQSQGQSSQEGLAALANLLSTLSGDLEKMEQAFGARLDSVRSRLSQEIEARWIPEKQWMEEKWMSSDQQISQLQKTIIDFREAQDQRQRRLQIWLIVVTFLAIGLLGLMIFNLFRNPAKPVSQEESAPVGQVEEPPVENITPVNTPVPELLSSSEAQSVIQPWATYTLNRIKSQSFDHLADRYWDPGGVEFFPFGLGSPGRKLTLEELKTAPASDQVYEWGAGSDGKPVTLTFADYFQQYVNGADFYNAPSVHYNEITFPGRANLRIEELARHFGSCIFVEYVVGEKSLVLVFGEGKKVRGVVYVE